METANFPVGDVNSFHLLLADGRLVGDGELGWAFPIEAKLTALVDKRAIVAINPMAFRAEREEKFIIILSKRIV
jgi:hypothetical protein